MAPTYYFQLRGEDYEVPDLTGTACADDEAARAEAERLARELVETARITGGPPPSGAIEVIDGELRPIVILPLALTGA
jgi:hypothetical protein